VFAGLKSVFSVFEPYFESIHDDPHDDPTLFPHGFHMGPMDFSHFVGTPKWLSSKVAPQGCIPDVWNLSSENSTGLGQTWTDTLSFCVCVFVFLFQLLPLVFLIFFGALLLILALIIVVTVVLLVVFVVVLLLLSSC
jgi:hypothetical protein